MAKWYALTSRLPVPKKNKFCYNEAGEENMTPEFIIDANELNFEYEVIAFSKNVPVLVDFWAEWCQPCKMLSPLLERLVQEANGSLRLAKVNIDQNPNLAMQYLSLIHISEPTRPY